jgi:putative thiamine transport system permease protein
VGSRLAALAAAGLLAALIGAALAVLALWSLAGAWRFPAALPSPWSLATWRAQAPLLASTALTTAGLGLASAALAVLLAVAWLEEERRGAPKLSAFGRGVAPLIAYAPLLVPQIAFVAGLQRALILLRLDGGFLGLLWSHLVYALPYAMLTLADPWRALDPRYRRAAACLGAPPWRVLARVVLPLLARPLLAAGAVAFAVSAGLYLPTLFAGAGRWDTLTTEALALAAGADRRVLGTTALLQAALPLLAFALAAARRR